jgi:hypothetical protein
MPTTKGIRPSAGWRSRGWLTIDEAPDADHPVPKGGCGTGTS